MCVHIPCKAGYTLFANHNKTRMKRRNWYIQRIVVCRRCFVAFCETFFCETWFVLFCQASSIHDELKEIFHTNWRSRLKCETLDDQRIVRSTVFFVFRELTIFYGETFVSSMFRCGSRIVCSPLIWPQYQGSRWKLHTDNVWPHFARNAMDFLAKKGVKIIPHPTYSPDFAVRHFSLSWVEKAVARLMVCKLCSSYQYRARSIS